MPRYARIERHALADALLAAGPDAPTLCGDWKTGDLAAHVVVRDRRPDAAPGIVFKPLAGWTDRVRDRYRDAHPYPDLVAMVRNGPRLSPMNLSVLDEMANTVEFFVHTEDARRGRGGWEPRALESGLAAALWQRLPPLVRLNLRRIPDTVRVEAPGHGAFTIGDGEPSVTVTGDPGELLLFFMGRQGASRIDTTGDTAAVTRLAGAQFGI